MTNYLSMPEVLLIQEMLLDRFGGIHGITEYGFGKLEAALAAPQQTMFGEELYPTVVDKAAIFFYSLVRGHCFSDGNKRTALVAALEFLQRNDAALVPLSDDELYEFVVSAASTLSSDENAAWFSTHVVEKEGMEREP